MEPAQLAAVVGGVCLLVAALGWRSRTRRQLTWPVRQALVDPNPETRRAAVYLAAEHGLTPYVELLAERIRRETDPGVVAALAEVIQRNLWEPADNGRVWDLRLWAQQYFLEQEGSAGESREAAYSQPMPSHRADAGMEAAGARATVVDRRSRPATPREEWEPLSVLVEARPAPPAAAPGTGNGHSSAARPVTSADTIAGAENGAVPGAVLTKPPVTRASAPPEPAAPRRTSPKVIVTSAGGPAGIAVVRALETMGHGAVAIDFDGLAAGMRLATESALVPRVEDPTYVDALCELATRTGASVIVPTLSEELLVLTEAAQALTRAGLHFWLPAPVAVDTCLDKWRFARLLKETGIAGPPTGLGSPKDVPGAWVVKPRFGRGSRDVYFVDRVSDLAWALQRVPEPIVQTRLTGREFTVDALVDRDGKLAGAVPRWRLETRCGISTKGRTFADEGLVEAVGQLLSVIGLTGPANVQGFMASDGTPWFVEVNPRFSGGLPLSLAAGADLVGEYVRAVLGERIRPERLGYRPGLTMIRHFEELYE